MVIEAQFPWPRRSELSGAVVPPVDKQFRISSVMVTDLIVYTFSRSKVERGDFSHFLNLHAPDKLPTGRRLRAMMGSMVLCVDGYDDDPVTACK